ncbi:DEAD/DEAH box helicase family protein (plasmid) [Azospirillum oryzae]|uniref:DEAD/DEAH box helicase family protein n=1 Tax=Azospirillum oryzae TaxID=286727 RepID=A0A6N1AGB7_9PROT|nr:DEAD/DEAH box helicase family protein [Azospirillum oryzae]KAA0588822.1 hypothetical protein FZ938_13270 [Azospirillum oryzae]QKS50168.1 DEAD/DEAH box helicase family protein [Azospirillum oryzae]GLR80266.1 hypothetical protein GCM10007856_29440 [Azospirillum oryzae]
MTAEAAIASLVGGPSLLPLRKFQTKASDTILNVVRDTAAKIEAARDRRRDIAKAQGVTLLRAPTGSGKTLTVGRTLERMVGGLPRKTCWFWFTPYSGLVTQTQDALRSQCRSIRMRDLKTDRHLKVTKDGDVFIATWASVASAKKDAKKARRNLETLAGVDLFIAALRADGWYIGVVIDEAHLNFGTGARRAAEFYLDVLQPDFTILATATPRDEELERFAKIARIGTPNRVEVGREEVVRACLNKPGVRAVHFRAEEKEKNLFDMEEVAIYAGWERHLAIKRALKDEGVDLTPLLLIQVENDKEGEDDRVKQVVTFLKTLKVPDSAIGWHTSSEPDPYFHTLAYDETKEVLIFKMAAATGFDAPRAWTLVSLRKSVGEEFGLQVLGRIMRVHPRVQHLHAFASEPPRLPNHILDHGYVFLANPDQQVAMTAAAEELKTIQDSIETVTDNVVVVDFGSSKAALFDPRSGFAELLVPPTPASGDKGAQEAASAHEDVHEEPESTSDPDSSGGHAKETVQRAAALRVQSALDFILEAPEPSLVRSAGKERLSSADPGTSSFKVHRYPLRTDITFPRRLSREVKPRTMDGLVACIAERIQIDDAVVNLVNRTKGKVVVTEEEVFGHEVLVGTQSVPISNVRIAQEAQMAFRFNDGIDERELRPALVSRLRRELDDRGQEVEEKDLRRAVNLIAMTRPSLLHDACRSCLASVVEIHQDVDIPDHIEAMGTLQRSAKSVYGVFPSTMNREERAFADLLDADTTGTVLWWLRNVENTRWAVSIVLPNGRLHYPDFVIGVDARRKSEDNIALAEVKDDGRTGRLFSRGNTDKVRSEHARYKSALMVYRDEVGDWIKAVYRADIERLTDGERFKISDLVYTQ